MHVDIPTIFLSQIVVGATLSLTTALSISKNHDEGARYWSAAFALNAGFYLLELFRGRITDVVTLILANMLMAASFSMILEGIYRFYDRRAPRILIWLPVILIGLGLFVEIHALRSRIMIASIVLSVQSLHIILALNRYRTESVGMGQYIVSTGMGVALILLVARSVSAVSGVGLSGVFMASDAVEVASGLVGMLCLILISHGLLVMIKDRADERTRALATRDPLTGLSNRHRLDATLASEWARARRARGPLALIMIDVDSFKKFNDFYGHPAGDRCLSAIAGIIRARTRRAGDLAIRYGGEEFLLILPGLQVAAAAGLAEQIRAAVEALDIPHADAPLGRVTVSAGCASMEPDGREGVDSLLNEADRALYLAKAERGNQVRGAPILGDFSLAS